ncbi:46275_t:CDS:1, partial [Gigaspora margarita]
MKAKIKDISILTGSDHKLVWAEIETSAILNNGKLRTKEEKGPTRRVSYIIRQLKKTGSPTA